MKQLTILVTIALMTFSLVACNEEKAVQATTPAPAAEKSESTPAADPAPASTSSTGTVIETMNASGYTYVYVDTGESKIWAAAPEFAVAVGDEVMVPEGMAMHNYHSQTLNRDFEVVYFVEAVLNTSNPEIAGASGMSGMSGMAAAANPNEMPAGHPAIDNNTVPSEIDLTNIAKADNGMTIAEIYANKADLADKTVTLRGKVVKFSPQIMGTNWLHLQDGSGDATNGTHDLTITSSTQVKVGDTVVASATLTLDKDFGYGYKYDLIVEDAQVTVE